MPWGRQASLPSLPSWLELGIRLPSGEPSPPHGAWSLQTRSIPGRFCSPPIDVAAVIVRQLPWRHGSAMRPQGQQCAVPGNDACPSTDAKGNAL